MRHRSHLKESRQWCWLSKMFGPQSPHADHHNVPLSPSDLANTVCIDSGSTMSIGLAARA
jgi:hypothetical protein